MFLTLCFVVHYWLRNACILGSSLLRVPECGLKKKTDPGVPLLSVKGIIL